MEWLFIRFAIWGSYPFLFLFDDTSISWSVFSTGSFWSNDHFSNGFTHFRAYFSCCTLDPDGVEVDTSIHRICSTLLLIDRFFMENIWFSKPDRKSVV